MAKCTTFLAVALLATVGLQVLADVPFKTFKDLLRATNRLETAESLFDQKSPQLTSSRAALLAQFAYEIKTDQCSVYLRQVKILADDFRGKAINYIHEVNNKGQNWFTGLFGGPLGPLKGLSKNEPMLQEITNRYEQQADRIKEKDINCDMIKFRMAALDSIFFVLNVDVKYLVTEKQQIMNKNIQDQLVNNKFKARHNFYNINGLKLSQKDLLVKYYLSYNDADETTIEKTIEHSHEASSLIVGRLLDTCNALKSFRNTWDAMEKERQETCADSGANSLSRLGSKDGIRKYERVLEFCSDLLVTTGKDVE